MTIQSEIMALQNDEGLIIPEVVLDWARSHTRSELYKAINWSDEHNIRLGLLSQVRTLIKLHIVTEDREPAVISLSIDRAKEGGYREKEDVLETPQLRAIMLLDALHEFELLQQRYAELEELEPVWEAARAIRRPRPRRGRGGEDRVGV